MSDNPGNDPIHNQRIGIRNKRMQEIRDRMNSESQVMPLSAAGNSIPQSLLNQFKEIAIKNDCPEEYAIIQIVKRKRNNPRGHLMKTDWHQGNMSIIRTLCAITNMKMKNLSL